MVLLRLSVFNARDRRISGVSIHGRCGVSTCAKCNVARSARAARLITSSNTGICDIGPPLSHCFTVVEFAFCFVSSVKDNVVVGPGSVVGVAMLFSNSPLSIAPKPPQPSSIAGNLARSPLGSTLWPTTTRASFIKDEKGVR